MLPQVIAIGNIQSGTIAGKLNGVMPTQTPTGWRMVSQSTLVAMFSRCWPMIRLGMPQANSTTSMPRWTLAPRFGQRLAMLARDERGQLIEFWFSSSRKRNMTRARSTTGVSAQAGSAAAAA